MELATASEVADARPGSVPGTPAISVRSVSKSFPVPGQGSSSLRDRLLHPSHSAQQVQALRNVSLEVRHGEVFGVVGRNGSGKSTLMRCLAGIYRPDSGSVAVEG